MDAPSALLLPMTRQEKREKQQTPDKNIERNQREK